MSKVVLSVEIEFGPDGSKAALKQVRNGIGDDITAAFRNFAAIRGADVTDKSDWEQLAGEFAKEFGGTTLLP